MAIWNPLRTYFFKSKPTKISSGFTLIEMIIAFSIFAILTGVVLFDGRTARRQFQVSNITYDVALLFRKAQRLGISAGSPQDLIPPRIGVYVATDGFGQIETLTLYRNVDGITGYDTNYDTIIDQYVLNVANLPVKLSLCSSISVSNNSCQLYTNSASIEFERASDDFLSPQLDHGFTGAVASSLVKRFGVQVEYSLGTETKYSYIVITPSGVISVY